MSLRRRLWLVLGGLFLVPLAVGALVLLLVVPDARNDHVTADVDSCRRDRPRRARRRVPQRRPGCAGRSARVGRQRAREGGRQPGRPGRCRLRRRPRRHRRGAGHRGCPARRQSSAGPTAAVLVRADDRCVAVVAERVDIDDPAHPGRVVVVAKRLDRELLDEVRSRSGTSGDVVLLDGKHVVVSTLDAKTTRAPGEQAPTVTPAGSSWTGGSPGSTRPGATPRGPSSSPRRTRAARAPGCSCSSCWPQPRWPACW